MSEPQRRWTCLADRGADGDAVRAEGVARAAEVWVDASAAVLLLLERHRGIASIKVSVDGEPPAQVYPGFGPGGHVDLAATAQLLAAVCGGSQPGPLSASPSHPTR